jgi:hypothetical protein
LDVRLSRVAKEREDTAKKLARTKELLDKAADELRKALHTVNELHDRGRAQEAKHAKLTAELRDLGSRMSVAVELDGTDDEEEALDAEMESDRGSDSGRASVPEQPETAAPVLSGATSHASCGCLRGRWADMSSPGATLGEVGGDQMADLLAQGAEALKRQEPPELEGGPEDPKRAKAGARKA